MVLVDTNVWLALALPKHEHHASARAWIDTQSEAGSVLFCRSTEQSLLQLLTTAAVLKAFGVPPLSNADAWAVYDGFRADRRSGFAKEPAGIERWWKAFASRPTASPKLWMDAYLAAFARAGHITLISTDSAFTQFDGLNLVVLRDH